MEEAVIKSTVSGMINKASVNITVKFGSNTEMMDYIESFRND